VIPPVIARYLTNRFQSLLILAPIIGALCGAVGMYLSFYLDIASAATIVLTSAILFFTLEIFLSFRRQQSAPAPRFPVDPAKDFR
jgi:ABC-type Mn2+/Zn2+ transport system permease subunit